MTQRRQEMGEEGNKLQLGSLQLEGFQSLGSYLSDNECLSTPWLAGGWLATDTQLGWLFLPHCSSLLASRPAGASSHDSSGRAAKSNKRKPFMCRYFSSLFLWHSGYWPIAQGKSLVKPGSLYMGTTQGHGYKETYPQLQQSAVRTVMKGRRGVPGLQFLFNLSRPLCPPGPEPWPSVGRTPRMRPSPGPHTPVWTLCISWDPI